MGEDILKRLGDILKDDHNAFTRATAIAAQAEIMRLEERSKGLRRERDKLRAELAAEREQKVEAMAAVIRAVNMKIAAEEERDALREENARLAALSAKASLEASQLREALKPFAYIAEHVGEEDARWAVPSAHLRAAAAAIREGGKDD